MTNNHDERRQPEASSDRAIEHRHQDRLDRKRFSNNIARAIVARRGRDSFVIALQGPWGSGKTSIKAMVLESLRVDSFGEGFDEDQRPLIVHFEPWQYRGADALFRGFFDEVAARIARSGQPDAAAKSKAIESYRKKVSLASQVVATTGKLAAFGGALGAVISGALNALSEALKAHGEQAKEGAEALKPEEKDARNLHDFKQGLRKQMRAMKRPLLIVIDDIDRLFADEMAQVFQLVKANADFPNFSYLLILQREAVEEGLAKVIAGNAGEYLEKIIQMSIDVPEPDAAQSAAFFVNELSELCRALDIQVRPDDLGRLIDLLTRGLDAYLQDLRDVRRLLNALEFSLPLLAREKNLNVNLADLCALEAIRVSSPALHRVLPRHRDLLTGQLERTSQAIARDVRAITDSNRSRSEPAAELDPQQTALVSLARLDKARGTDAELLLRALFPRAPWPDFDPDVLLQRRQSHRGQGVAELGVGSPESFGRYFQLALGAGELSEAEVALFIRDLLDAGLSLARLRQAEQRGHLETLLRRLSARIKEAPPKYLQPFLTALLSISDEIDPRRDQEQRLASWFYVLYDHISTHLDSEPNATERETALIAAFERTSGVFQPAVSAFYSKNGEQQAFSALQIGPEAQARIEEIARGKIERLAGSGELLSYPRMRLLLQVWEGLDSLQAVQNWTRDTIQTPGQALLFLDGMASETQAFVIGGPALQTEQIDFDSLRKYASVESLRQLLEQLDEQALDEKQKRRIAVLERLATPGAPQADAPIPE